MISRITTDDPVDSGKIKMGELYQSDVGGDDIILLCLEDGSDDEKVSVVVLRFDTTRAEKVRQAGEIVDWLTSRLKPFLGRIELSN